MCIWVLTASPFVIIERLLYTVCMFEQVFKNVDDILRKDACSTELDYIEQSSWILFLRYLEEYEKEQSNRAVLLGKEYTPLFEKRFRWGSWAVAKDAHGKRNHRTELVGDDLIHFVNNTLFPYLQGFRSSHQKNTLEYKIGELFAELKNKIESGYNLRGVLCVVNLQYK